MSARELQRGEVRGLKPDTALARGIPAEETYVRHLPACCLSAFEAAVAEEEERVRRWLSFECLCGESWRVTSSHDVRVLERFVVHGGPRVGSSPPAG